MLNTNPTKSTSYGRDAPALFPEFAGPIIELPISVLLPLRQGVVRPAGTFPEERDDNRQRPVFFPDYSNPQPCPPIEEVLPGLVRVFALTGSLLDDIEAMRRIADRRWADSPVLFQAGLCPNRSEEQRRLFQDQVSIPGTAAYHAQRISSALTEFLSIELEVVADTICGFGLPSTTYRYVKRDNYMQPIGIHIDGNYPPDTQRCIANIGRMSRRVTVVKPPFSVDEAPVDNMARQMRNDAYLSEGPPCYEFDQPPTTAMLYYSFVIDHDGASPEPGSNPHLNYDYRLNLQTTGRKN